MNLKQFWYIACESKDLILDRPQGVQVLNEWIVLYRGKDGKPIAAMDRCLHRNARLSKGIVKNGELICPYHGWQYGGEAKVTAIPSEGSSYQPKANMCLPLFECVEKEGYVYVRLEKGAELGVPFQEPYGIPFLGQAGYQHIRLKHIFKAEVPNCAENFIDIPHTSFVHPNVFRYQKEPQKLEADIELKDGNVHIRYHKETSNFGVFSRFLNRSNAETFHEDHYYLPNMTHVEYRFPSGKHFNITSQSIPTGPMETTVYTDLTYNYGIWNWLARPFVYLTAKIIIGQDVRIMREQSEVTEHYGEQFVSTRADYQHILIERVYAALREGKDPRGFTAKKERVEFWI